MNAVWFWVGKLTTKQKTVPNSSAPAAVISKSLRVTRLCRPKKAKRYEVSKMMRYPQNTVAGP